ncbi:hypothetical protein Btru_028310 [Bulinus truncatus]|nr:hypothetical protein Btru_028310 [Bulinus truncatus]
MRMLNSNLELLADVLTSLASTPFKDFGSFVFVEVRNKLRSLAHLSVLGPLIPSFKSRLLQDCDVACELGCDAPGPEMCCKTGYYKPTGLQQPCTGYNYKRFKIFLEIYHMKIRSSLEVKMFGKIIVIKRTGTDGAHFPLTANTCLFGRGQDCDIRIQMPSVDNEQCVVNVDDKGHVFLKNLSTISPTLINEKALSGSLTALSHGDIITIIDRKFRFEFPIESQFFPKSPRAKSPKTARLSGPDSASAKSPKSPRVKSPKTARKSYPDSPSAKSPKSSGNVNIINETIIDLKSPAKLERKSPKPLTPRTDNVPVSEVYSNSPQKQSFPSPLKDVLANEVSTFGKSLNSSSKYLMSPASFYNSTYKGLKRLSDVPRTKVTPVQKMTPGTSSQTISTPISSERTTMASPGRKSGSNLYVRTNESLQKSINLLKRRSMPLFERDEEATSLVESPATEVNQPSVQSGKRKSSSFVMLSAKRKRVSFGPNLSPEHFDKTLPPKTPVKKGATPSRVNPGRKSLLKRNSPKSLTPKNTIPRKSSPGAKAVAASEDNLSVSAEAVSVLETVISPSNQNSSKKQTGKKFSVDTALSKQNFKEVIIPDVLQSPRIPPRTRSLTPSSSMQDDILSTKRSSSASPKYSVSDTSCSSIADSPMLSQDLFSQQSPLVTETSITSDKNTASGKKISVRAKSEGPAISSESFGPVNRTKKRVKSLGAIPQAVVGLTQKVKSVTLLGSSPLNVVHYKKTPVVRRIGKLDIIRKSLNKKHSFDVSLTGLKELVKTPKAGLIDTSFTGIVDLFNVSGVGTDEAPASSQLDILKNSSSASLSRKRSRTPKKEPPRGRSFFTELAGLPQLFSTPTSHLVASAGVRSTGDSAVTPGPMSTGKLTRTPKRDLVQSPAVISANIITAGGSPVSKKNEATLDETDGYKATNDAAISIGTPLPIESRKRGRPSKKLSTDVSFSIMSTMFKSPENVTVNSSPILSPKKAGTPIATSVFATPDQQVNASKSKMSTSKSADLTLNVDMRKSVKRNRTPKKFFDEISPLSSKKTPATQKSPLKSRPFLKTPSSQKLSPAVVDKSTEKIKSPPQDRNKVVALRVIHGHAITPKLPGLAKTPKLTEDTTTTKFNKTPSKTPKSLKKPVARNSVKTWSDIVKSGIPKPMTVGRPSLFTSNAAAEKKKRVIPLKHTVRTPKTPRALARALAPSTGHAESPATILVGKKLTLNPKTPKLLPRKGRKQPVGKVSRLSTGNTTFSGLPEMFKTPEAGNSADISALYDQIPDTPNGPNEMFVSPLSASKGNRKSAILTGVRELFAHKNRQSMKLAGVRELLKSPKLASPVQNKSITPTGLKRLMKTPYVSSTPKDLKHILKTPKASPKITPSGLKRMMKIPTYASPHGVENLFQEIEEEVPKSSSKGRPPKMKETDAPNENADSAEKSSNETVVIGATSVESTTAGTKRKAVAINAQILSKKLKGSPFVEKPEVLTEESSESGDKLILKRQRGRKKQSAQSDVNKAVVSETSSDIPYVFSFDGNNEKSTEQAELGLKPTTVCEGGDKPESETVQLQNLTTVSRPFSRALAASVEKIAPIVDSQSAPAPVVKKGRERQATVMSSENLTVAVFEDVVTNLDVQSPPASVVKRGRGRQATKKSAEIVEAFVEDVVAGVDSLSAPAPVVKRGRGRQATKKKSENVAEVVAEDVTIVDSQSAPTPVVKRGRGRQATVKSSETVAEDVTSVDSQSAPAPVVKRGRGRQATVKSSETVAEDVTSVDSQSAPAPVVKRGRGRQATVKSSETVGEDVTSVDSQSAPAPVVKRGRQATVKSSGNVAEDVTSVGNQSAVAPAVKKGRGKQTTKKSADAEIVTEASVVELELPLENIAEQENTGDILIEEPKKRGSRTKTVVSLDVKPKGGQSDLTVETSMGNSSNIEVPVSVPKRGRNKASTKPILSSVEKDNVLEKMAPARAVEEDIQDLKIVAKRGKRTVVESVSYSPATALEPVVELSSKKGRSRAAKSSVSADSVTELGINVENSMKRGRKKIAEAASTTIVDPPTTAKSSLARRNEAVVKLIHVDNLQTEDQSQADKKGRRAAKMTTSIDGPAVKEQSVAVEKQRSKPVVTFKESVSDLVASEIKPAKRGRGRAGASPVSHPLVAAESLAKDDNTGKKESAVKKIKDAIEVAKILPSPVGKRVKGRRIVSSAEISQSNTNVSGDQNGTNSSKVKVLTVKRATKVAKAVPLEAAEPAPSTEPLQKTGTKRAKRTVDTLNITVSAIPEKRSKSSKTEAVTSTNKQTRPAKVTATNTKQVKEIKSKLDEVEVSRSTRGRRK